MQMAIIALHVVRIRLSSYGILERYDLAHFLAPSSF